MAPPKTPLPDREELERLYWKAELSLREIGALYHCKADTVSRRMRELNIPSRGRGAAGRRYDAEFIAQCKNAIKIKMNKTTKEQRSVWGRTGYDAMVQVRCEYHAKRRPSVEELQRFCDEMPDWNITTASEAFGFSRPTMRKYLREAGILPPKPDKPTLKRSVRVNGYSVKTPWRMFCPVEDCNLEAVQNYQAGCDDPWEELQQRLIYHLQLHHGFTYADAERATWDAEWERGECLPVIRPGVEIRPSSNTRHRESNCKVTEPRQMELEG